MEARPELARGVREAGASARRAGDPHWMAPDDLGPLLPEWQAGWAAEDRVMSFSDRYREAERLRCFNLWQAAEALAGSPGAAYFAARGLIVPARARLRYHANLSYERGWIEDGAGRRVRKVLHQGPAWLAAIVDAGRLFSGIYCRWIDAAGEPVQLADAETGEVAELTQARGPRRGGVIELLPMAEPARIVLGASIDSVLALHAAMSREGKTLEATALWAALDMDALGGPAEGSMRHPDLKHRNGHRLLMRGPEPATGEKDADAIRLPGSAREVVLVGSGRAEPVAAATALGRAAIRYRRQGRKVAVVTPPAGQDFEDLVKGEAT